MNNNQSPQIFINYDLYTSKAFLSLKGIAPQLLVLFLDKHHHSKDGKIIFTDTEAAKKYGITGRKFFHAKKYLFLNGFVDLHSVMHGKRGVNLYTMSNRWKKYGLPDYETQRLYPKQKGYVYLIKTQDAYKIGITCDINKRFKKYTTENPYPIELIFSYLVNDYLNIEKDLHQKFSQRKLHNEWFYLDKSGVEEMRTYLQCYI